MTTPSGQISLSDVNNELGYTSTQNISMDSTVVRTLASGGQFSISGQITMDMLRSRSRPFYNITLTSNTANYNIRNACIALGWGGILPATVWLTISSNVIMYSTSTSTPGLDTGSFPTGSIVYIFNYGYIVGRGGAGGAGASTGAGGGGSSGGTALLINYPTFINNYGYVLGGGGGGGGGGSLQENSSSPYTGAFTLWFGGGGGGGGQGVDLGSGGAAGSSNSAYSGETLPAAGGMSSISASVIAAVGGAGYSANPTPGGEEPYYYQLRSGAGGAGGGWASTGSGGGSSRATYDDGVTPIAANTSVDGGPVSTFYSYVGGSPGSAGPAVVRLGGTLTWQPGPGIVPVAAPYVRGQIV